MFFQYVSRPSGTPAEKCMVYPLSPGNGAEAYNLYASASGADKWKDLFAKIEAESNAVRGSRGVYVTIVLDDEIEEHRKRHPGVDIYTERELTEMRELYDQNEREHSSLFEFRSKLGSWIGSLVVAAEGIDPSPGYFDSIDIISDKSLGDTVIAMITVLPVNIAIWWETSD